MNGNAPVGGETKVTAESGTRERGGEFTSGGEVCERVGD